jgi:PadR family transcriptional regulator PadR
MAKSDVLQGTLDLLILKTLASRAPIHGYGITAHIQRTSDSALRVEEGSLYPALRRLEQEGLIQSDWRLSETNRRARFYQLTSKGRKHLKAVEENWRNLTGAVARVLQYE